MYFRYLSQIMVSFQSVPVSFHLSVSLSACLSGWLAVYLCFTYLPMYSSVHLSILLIGSLYAPAYLPAYLEFIFKPLAAVWTLLCLCTNAGESIANNTEL